MAYGTVQLLHQKDVLRQISKIALNLIYCTLFSLLSLLIDAHIDRTVVTIFKKG